MKKFALLLLAILLTPVTHGMTMSNSSDSMVVLTISYADWWFPHIYIVEARNLDYKFMEGLVPNTTADFDIDIDSKAISHHVEHWHITAPTTSHFDIDFDTQQNWFVLAIDGQPIA